jgi:hypothetical protein
VTDFQLAWVIAAPVAAGLVVVLTTWAISRTAGDYDRESDEIAQSIADYDAACEGALIAELSDHAFVGSGK